MHNGLVFKEITKVFIQFLNRPESWIFLPDYVVLSVSNDGKEWLDINRSDFAHSRGETRYIREAKLQFSEYTSPKRYLKIFAKNIGKCPKGHVGEGQAAWLFADEIIVE
jgi:hexosaminidase